MGEATVRWLTDLHFVGTGSNQHSVVLSGAQDGIGVKPSEMLLVALASCSAVDVVEILRKKRQELTMLEIKVSSESDPEPPWTVRQIHIQYRLGGKGLTVKSVSQAIDLSEQKYCSVAATVRGVAKITTEFEIISNELV
jgi:putative redox protein